MNMFNGNMIFYIKVDWWEKKWFSSIILCLYSFKKNYNFKEWWIIIVLMYKLFLFLVKWDKKKCNVYNICIRLYMKSNVLFILWF